jgi:hypothetical protein
MCIAQSHEATKGLDKLIIPFFFVVLWLCAIELLFDSRTRLRDAYGGQAEGRKDARGCL